MVWVLLHKWVLEILWFPVLIGMLVGLVPHHTSPTPQPGTCALLSSQPWISLFPLLSIVRCVLRGSININIYTIISRMKYIYSIFSLLIKKRSVQIPPWMIWIKPNHWPKSCSQWPFFKINSVGLAVKKKDNFPPTTTTTISLIQYLIHPVIHKWLLSNSRNHIDIEKFDPRIHHIRFCLLLFWRKHLQQSKKSIHYHSALPQELWLPGDASHKVWTKDLVDKEASWCRRDWLLFSNLSFPLVSSAPQGPMPADPSKIRVDH